MVDSEWFDAPAGDALSIQKEDSGIEHLGYYIGRKTIETEMGETVLWRFQDKQGKPFSIWGFTNLNFQMENVPIGSFCKIVYQGRSEQKNKFGKFPHKAKVQISKTLKLEKVDDEDDVSF